ncbi:MAG: PqqD family peptide modification chaperone [Phycisphaerae bacterium]|nr:PqqD family peptide modification chaperone [Phycisphaerae bacterium]
MIERPTFSPFWHRVRTLRPRLRPHVQITRQHFRGRRWHVAHDPASNHFYRLNPVAHDFVASLDGRRSIDEAWKLSLAKFADRAPTQNEIIELLGQLHGSNLLSLDAPPDVEQMLTRSGERRRKKIKQQLIGLMYFRLRLFNPDAIITALEPFFRPLINRLGLALWVVLILAGLAAVAPRWGELSASLSGVTNPEAWGWIAVAFVLLKAWHELGHGVICKRYGGAVPEAGVMMLVLLPAPYVDASACWAFDSRWKRIAVGAGGMIFELAAAAAAAMVWAALPQGHPARDVCFYLMLMAGISTVLFNANPLMRFDGYYVLSDLLEVPNLMPRSMEMMKHFFKRYVYRLPNQRPPTGLRGEWWLLIVYGVLSLAYRIFLFLVIALYLLGFFFVVGVILALWTAVAWFVLPIGSFAHWLAASSDLAERRGRAILTSAALAAAAVVLVGLVPVPDYRRGSGVVESLAESGVFTGAEGFVVEAFKRPGDPVRAGEVIVRMESPELEANRRAASAQLAGVLARLGEARLQDDPATAAGLEREERYWRQVLADLTDKTDRLAVRSPHDGVVAGLDPMRLLGAYLTRGKPVCGVVDPSRLRVAASMSQAEASWLYGLPAEDLRVTMRPVSDPWRPIDGAHVRAVPAAQKRLSHAALGFGGGGSVETAPNDPEGVVARREQFIVYVEAAGPALAGTTPGERVKLRFSLPAKPLLEQVVDRIHRTIQGRVDL